MKTARKPRATGAGKIKPLTERERAYIDWKAKQDRENEMFPGIHLARELDTSTLKNLWDESDGAVTSQPNLSGHAVRQALTERGEGTYCA
jgi:hypothetical protein